MEIQLNRKSLLLGLQRGGSMAGISKAYPLLVNVRLTLANGRLVVSSSSMDSGVRYSMVLDGVDGSLGFDILVDYQDLMKGLKTLRDDVVVFVVDSERNVFSIKHGKGLIKLSCQGVDGFPEIERVDSDRVWDVDSSMLRMMVDGNRLFVSADNLKAILCGVYMYFGGGMCGVCATDTRVMYTDRFECSSAVNGDNVGCVIPTGVLSSLIDLLSNGSSVKVKIGDNGVAFKCGDMVMTCKVVNGKYPDFNRVIPTGNDITAVVSKGELLDSLKRVVLYSDRATSLVRIDLSGMTFGIRAIDNAMGKGADESCVCEHAGRDLVIGANGDMMNKCLSLVTSDDIRMTFKESTSPILIFDSNYPERRILLMPMMVN